MSNETEIREEIDATRDQLGEKLDQIGDRVIPGRILERRKSRVANRFQAIRERVMGAAEDNVEHLSGAADSVRQAPHAAVERAQGNPLAAGAVAFGVGVLVSSMWKPSETERRAAQAATEMAPELTEEIKDAGREAVTAVKEQAGAATSELRTSASDAAHEVVGAATQS
jgi:ElaB/YqjD/DUF883 family membrane-anchored ribosome-binding protein